METESTPPITPNACDMTDAPDTATERIAEYQRLFSGGFIGRERIDSGIRFRFHLEEGLEKWVCDLASRERACCAFFTFSVTRHGDELWWEASVIDDDIARRILDEFYRLPDTLTQGVQAVHDRLVDQGLKVMIDDGGTLRPATPEELGVERHPLQNEGFDATVIGGSLRNPRLCRRPRRPAGAPSCTGGAINFG
jgi:hypothetical protein